MKVFKFINHASILAEYDGMSCLTDPWFISNAFGSWFPSPSPNKETIYQLIDSDKDLCVIVSHGHDDHLDNWFVEKHLQQKTFFYPKFRSPGLDNRLKALGVNALPIEDKKAFGNFVFRQFINDTYTGHDAVITIETPEYLIIHANDNWHRWPENMRFEISRLTEKYEESRVFFLVQFGIADCFPVNYRGFSTLQNQQIIQGRFENYLTNTISNMEAMKLQHIYYYANQSLFEYKESASHGASLYQQAQDFLNQSASFATQLVPGMVIQTGHNIINEEEKSAPLFRDCLNSLENFINQHYRKVCGNESYIPVRFRTFQEEPTDGEINYIASNEVWNRIIIGELTLESIIIGGSGVIDKPDVNIAKHHHFVSRYSYICQNMVKEKGLNFYREVASE